MNLRFLETFVTLARLGSFKKTAKALYATPAAISLRIKKLEVELDTPLIDRSERGIKLTTDGQYLLSYATNVVEASYALTAAVQEKSLEMGGHLRLGVNETIVHSWLSHLLIDLAVHYPDIDIELTIDNSHVLKELLLNNKLDLVVRIENIVASNIMSFALVSYPIFWIASASLLPLKKSNLLQWILKTPILTFERGTNTQISIENLIKQLASETNISYSSVRFVHTHSIATIIRLVQDGYGIATLPSLFVAKELREKKFIRIPMLPEPAPIVAFICFHMNAARYVHVAAQTIRSACTRFCADYPTHYIQLE